MKHRETMADAAARRRCPTCGKWYMSQSQRDAHVTKYAGKVHPA